MRKIKFWFKRYYITPGIYSLRNAVFLTVLLAGCAYLIKYFSGHLHPGQAFALIYFPSFFLLLNMTDHKGNKLPVLGWVMHGGVFIWLLFGPFFNLSPKNATEMDTWFNEYPLFFVFVYLIYFLQLANQKMLKRVEGEWWIDIRREGNTPTPDDLQVGKKEIDDALFIYGEPHTWWKQRIKEPQARAVLAQIKMQNSICTVTGSQIELKPETLYPKVRQWQYALNKNPPTPKDWKDSAADFSVPAHKKIATASQSGSPIAVPSLTGEDEG